MMTTIFARFAKVYLLPLVIGFMVLLPPGLARASIANQTYGQALSRFVSNALATTGLLLMCSTMACESPDQIPPASESAPLASSVSGSSISSPELVQALHNDYHDKDVLFINDFGQLTEGYAYKNNNTDWFWVSITNGSEVPVYEHEMVGTLAPDHEYVGTALLLSPLDGTGKNLLSNVNAIIDRVYITKKLVIEEGEEGADGKRSFARDVPTGYAITVVSGRLIDSGRIVVFHTPYSLLITESDVYH